MAEKKACLVCGKTEMVPVYTPKDYLVSGESFLISRCTVCGFTFTSNPPPEVDAHRYYVSEEYISHSDKKQNLTERLYHLVRNLMLRKKYSLVRKTTGKTTGSLIDIGSGTGYFAGFMKKRGWDVTGVEINDMARQFSVSRFDLKAVSPAEISGVKDGSVDCVTLWHVLEHLYNPALWINEIKRILKDDGRCLIALPNIKSADAEWFGNEWAALDVPRHLWHFSPETLKLFFQSHGLVCTIIKSMPFDVFYISILSCRNRGCRLPLLRGMATGVLLTIRTLLCKAEASSIVYVISRVRG